MAFDNLLMFRTSGNLTQSESNGPLTIRGTSIEGGMAGVVIVPSSAETLASVLPRYYVSDDDSTYTLLATYPGGAKSIDVNAGGSNNLSEVLTTPIVTDKKYVKEELVVAGTTATSFGAVVSGLVGPRGFDFSRAVGFE